MHPVWKLAASAQNGVGLSYVHFNVDSEEKSLGVGRQEETEEKEEEEVVVDGLWNEYRRTTMFSTPFRKSDKKVSSVRPL